MNDETFNAVGILAWYKKEDMDKWIDWVAIANAFAQESVGRTHYYEKFNADDFPKGLFNV